MAPLDHEAQPTGVNEPADEQRLHDLLDRRRHVDGKGHDRQPRHIQDRGVDDVAGQAAGAADGQRHQDAAQTNQPETVEEAQDEQEDQDRQECQRSPRHEGPGQQRLTRIQRRPRIPPVPAPRADAGSDPPGSGPPPWSMSRRWVAARMPRPALAMYSRSAKLTRQVWLTASKTVRARGAEIASSRPMRRTSPESSCWISNMCWCLSSPLSWLVRRRLPRMDRARTGRSDFSSDLGILPVGRPPWQDHIPSGERRPADLNPAP